MGNLVELVDENRAALPQPVTTEVLWTICFRTYTGPVAVSSTRSTTAIAR